MDDKTLASLHEIINYLFADEEKNWLEAGRPARDHIFHDIMRITEWLDSAAQK
ncbi:MAG: hypothetical protein ABSH38_11440 [Verrucomicrobiota bacterium]|jgi:hypothetical protein